MALSPEDADLLVLINSQCSSISTSLFNRAAQGRPLTMVALADIRRQLAHLERQVSDAIAERATQEQPRS